MKNTKKRIKKIIIFLILAIFVISMINLLSFISPEEIVNRIGVRNGYILAFVVSFFGGFSAGGSISFISLLIALVAGGMNPVYLCLITGISLAIGDMIMFYIGSKGRELVRGRWNQRLNNVADMFKKRKWLKNMLPIISYLYIGFAPLPNDILILFLATVKYPPKKVNGIIILGDLTFVLMIIILATQVL